jgi:hypothetical protein
MNIEINVLKPNFNDLLPVPGLYQYLFDKVFFQLPQKWPSRIRIRK